MLENSPILHVVAGVLRDPQGRILLAQRHPSSPFAGLWEFPGGKCEPGESPEQALRRELLEELGVEIGLVSRLIRVPWIYPEKTIILEVYCVASYHGVAYAREGQALQWKAIAKLDVNEMLPADRPVVHALHLPAQYVITPSLESMQDVESLVNSLQTLLASGSRLLQLRAPRLKREDLRMLAVDLRAKCHRYDAQLLVNADIDLAKELNLDGVHLCSAQLFALDRRPLPSNKWVAASCHNWEELTRAIYLNVDFATLSPITHTSSHPGVQSLGWQQFSQLCEAAPFPVYALGGLKLTDLEIARHHGAQGIAGISAFWPPALQV